MFPSVQPAELTRLRCFARAAGFCLAAFFALLPARAQAQALDATNLEALLELETDTLERIEQPAHYVVVQSIDDGPLDVLHYQEVVMDGPLASRDDAKLTALTKAIEGRQNTTAIARLRDDISGEVVWQDVIRIPRWLRSEVSLPEGDPRIAERGGSNIDGVVMRAIEVTFVVRAPVVEGSTTLDVTHGEKFLRSTESIDLAALAWQFPTEDAAKAISGAVHEGVPGHFGGPPSNRLDVLFVGETSASLHWSQRTKAGRRRPGPTFQAARSADTPQTAAAERPLRNGVFSIPIHRAGVPGRHA